MWEPIYNPLLFLLAIGGLLFLPGWSFLLAVWGRNKALSKAEKFVFAFGFGLIILDFVSFALSRLGIAITPLTISLSLGVVTLLFLLITGWKMWKTKHVSDDEQELWDFSLKQVLLVFVLLAGIFFIKTVYLSGTIMPTATDMGHHMYWSKWMVENHALPTYEGMPDFIIGEHIVFGAIGMMTGLSFFSAFPPLVLHLINMLSILTVFFLVLRIFSNRNIAILSLLFLGVLFAVSSPQSKFVSGGVVGNIMGNFLMPLAFYFYFRAFEFWKNNDETQKNAKTFLSLAVFATFGLFYTHHLTSFIFLFVFSIALLLFVFINWKEAKNFLTRAAKMVFSVPVIATFLLGLAFFFLVFTPNYVKPAAVDTAVGAPSKATRVGLSMDNLKDTVGEFRLILGFVGLFFLLLSFRRRNFGYAILASWLGMILIMSTKPHWLLIDLPSSRIGNYLSYPAAVLGALAFYRIFFSREKDFVFWGKSIAWGNSKLLRLPFLLLFSGVIVFGVADSVNSFKKSNDFDDLIQTFHASRYVAESADKQDNFLKDHNYITGDAWIKLLFMREYRYPLSRGYFKRYEDPTNPREMCTLFMISNPGSDESQKCFQETQTRFILINPKYDKAQFGRLKEFDLVYESSALAIYYKNN